MRHPARELHVLDLASGAGNRRAGPASEPDTAAASDRPAAGAGLPVLDAAAKAAYQGRLAELRDDLAEAERFHDAGRAERARLEIEALAEQLAAAVGLGGRDRLAASDAERARSTITHGIRAALGRIAKPLPALASELMRGIRTGTFCSYRPDRHWPVDWLL